MKWYRRDCDSALTGMACLSLEARGLYNGLLDMIYSRDGDLPYDEELISRTLSISRRTWRKVSNELLDKGKIWVTPAGKIMAKRVEKELKSVSKRAEHAANNARKRWEKSENSNVINVEPMLRSKAIKESKSIESKSLREERKSPLGPDGPNVIAHEVQTDLLGQPAESQRKGKHRLPKDWEPSASAMQQAVDKLGSERAAFDALDEFRNYWWGCGRMMVRWDQVFLVRVAELARRQQSGRNGRYGGNGKRAGDALAGFVERYGHAEPERGH